MTRLIEIYDDNKVQFELDSDELPLEIYLIKNQLIVSTIKTIKEQEEKNVIGYIAQDEGHIFFQPNEGNSSNKLFHNDEIITKSVWLKSGDIIQFQKKNINYHISGDKIQIIVSDKSEIPTIISPSNNKIVNNYQSHQLTPGKVVAEKEYTNLKQTTSITTKLVVVTAILLMLVATFIVFAKTVVIDISPKADSVSLDGFFPVIKIGERYLIIGGKYSLKAEKKDYKSLNEKLNINSDNSKYSFSMQESPGFIELNIIPDKDNKIYIDNKLMHFAGENNNPQNSDERKYELIKGEHVISIINSRYKKYSQKINVEGKNKKQQYTIYLKPNWGLYSFKSPVEDTKVIIHLKNNKDKVVYNNIINEKKEIELISGHYTIQLGKDKYKDKIDNFTIEAGDRTSLEEFVFEPKDGVVNLTSIPSGSIIRVDGRYVGKTPKKLNLSSNKEHTLELSRNAFKTIQKKIILEPETIIDEKLTLAPKTGLVFITVSPKHAVLSIDGRRQKENSGKFILTENSHLLSVKAKGYETQNKKIDISHFSKNISFVMKKINRDKHINIAKKEKHKSYINSINQTMRLVNPDVFMMGSKKNEAGRSSNEQLHKIQLNYAFFLSEKEISNKQFRQFKASHNSGSSGNKSLNLDEQPVVNISWYEAAKYANWLSKQESLTPYYKEQNGVMIPVDINSKIDGYRLPFEAEWVLAARGHKQKKYPWSGNYPPKKPDANFADESARNHISNIIIGYNDNYSVASPIGSFPKNEWGFYDLGGNVSEWCQDYYSPFSGLSANKLAINPKGPKSGVHKVVRDSSWRDSSITELRLSYRSYSKKKSNDIGFRIARYAQ